MGVDHYRRRPVFPSFDRNVLNCPCPCCLMADGEADAAAGLVLRGTSLLNCLEMTLRLVYLLGQCCIYRVVVNSCSTDRKSM